LLVLGRSFFFGKTDKISMVYGETTHKLPYKLEYESQIHQKNVSISPQLVCHSFPPKKQLDCRSAAVNERLASRRKKTVKNNNFQR